MICRAYTHFRPVGHGEICEPLPAFPNLALRAVMLSSFESRAGKEMISAREAGSIA